MAYWVRKWRRESFSARPAFCKPAPLGVERASASREALPRFASQGGGLFVAKLPPPRHETLRRARLAARTGARGVLVWAWPTLAGNVTRIDIAEGTFKALALQGHATCLFRPSSISS